jgi:DNA-binding MarR family transcriptional regulator
MYEWYIYVVADETENSMAQLDEMLFELRTTMSRRDFGRRLIDGLAIPGGSTSLRILRVVQRRDPVDEAPSIRSVADELGLEHSTASRAVDALVRSKHLAKSASATDRRCSTLSLTPVGATSLQEVTNRRIGIVSMATRGWAAEDVVRLTELVGRLRRGIDAAL